MKVKMTEKEQEVFDKIVFEMLQPIYKTAVTAIENDEQIPAMLYALPLDGSEPKFYELQRMMDTDKNVADEFVRGIQSAPGMMATIMVSEAWMLSLKEQEVKDAIKRGEELRPSKHPAREEHVIFVVETLVGGLFASARISRDPSRLGALEIRKGDPDKPTQGRFMGGFENQPREVYRHTSEVSAQKYNSN